MSRKPAQQPDGAQPTFRRRGRILHSLLFGFIVVGLTPLAFVAWKLIDINREALTTSQQEYQLLLASSVAQQLNIHVDGLQRQVLQVAQTLGGTMSHGGTAPSGEIRKALQEVADPPLVYLRYSHSSQRGGAAISAGELPDFIADGFRASLQQTVERFAVSADGSRPGVALSDPIVEPESNHSLLLMSAPVVSRGRLRGVLSALVDLEAVWTSVTDGVRTGHTIYALDAGGRVFASNNPSEERPGRDATRSDLVKRFLAAGSGAIETLPYVEDQGGVRRSFLGSYAATDDQGWGVFVRAQERDVYFLIWEMIESTVKWSVVVIALAAVAAFLLAKILTVPIKRLTAICRNFADGDFKERAGTNTRNEVGELAHRFNTMADDIEQKISALRRALEENNALFLGTIRALAEAIDAKDPYTRGHSLRVNRYSVTIARTMGLSENDVRDIYVASLLHDVGKIGIDDSVLNKPGKLTDEEFALMKTHPVLGESIMKPIPQMRAILPGLRWHHERWEGGGYPDGLEGEQIPLMARIIAVADTFDAITTNRPYQKTMNLREAFAVINRLRGKNLDEQVVQAFFRAYHTGHIRLDPEATPQTVEAPPGMPGKPATPELV